MRFSPRSASRAKNIARRLPAAASRARWAHTASGRSTSGQTTWYGLTCEIYRLIGADVQRVHPTTTAQFPRPAPRPAYSVLGHDRWAQVGLAPMRDWRAALAEALPLMRS